TRVMNQLRIPTTNATEQTKIAAVINEVYRDIYAKEDWWFLIKRSVINTVAKINTGTVSVINSNTAITFSSAPAISVVGYILMPTGDSNDSMATYRIATHTAGAAAATLDAAYTGSTSTTMAYNLYKDSYSLPSDYGKLL